MWNYGIGFSSCSSIQAGLAFLSVHNKVEQNLSEWYWKEYLITLFLIHPFQGLPDFEYDICRLKVSKLSDLPPLTSISRIWKHLLTVDVLERATFSKCCRKIWEVWYEVKSDKGWHCHKKWVALTLQTGENWTCSITPLLIWTGQGEGKVEKIHGLR